MNILILHLSSNFEERELFFAFEKKLKAERCKILHLNATGPSLSENMALVPLADIDSSLWDCVFILGSGKGDFKIDFLNRRFNLPIYLFFCNQNGHVNFLAGIAHNKHNVFGVFYLNPTEKITAIFPFKKTFYFSNLQPSKKRFFNPSIGLDLFHTSKEFAHQIVKIFNTLPQFRLNVYGRPSDRRKLEPYFNSNISFINIIKEDLYFQDDGVLLSSSLNALHAAVSGIPVIIVGDKGFGGILLADNLFDHLESGISGRLGGYLGEEIPGNLVFQEINSIFALSESEIYENSERIRQLVSIENLFDNVIDHVRYRNWIFFKFHEGDYSSLTARLVEGLELTYTATGTANIILKSHNKLLYYLEVAESNFLRLLLSENSLSESIKQFVEINKESYESAVGFLEELWKNKILDLTMIMNVGSLE
ncbi:hypothetical protein [Sphingobacterium anhuiense]|uniref:DUF115 domain-containing protein n=1 Tax=Sphingobacterium anhuiense TaxID=493780 RepID=A0ABW5YQ77_9SPHI